MTNPKPLVEIGKLKDKELIYQIKENNSSAAVLELSSRHKGLVTKIIQKYVGAAQCSGVSFQDFISQTDYLVFKAAVDYDESKEAKWTTWLGNKTKYYCLNSLHKESKHYNTENEELTEDIANSVFNEEQDEQMRMNEHIEYIKEIMSQVTDKRVEKIMNMRYFSGEKKPVSFRVIANELGLTAQGVIDIHDKFISFLSKKMSNNEPMDEI